ncbi:hypothetical protein J3S90_09430 [Flavobacterium sp. P4023]|uniref:Immunity protein 10 n=1 Tax=Flavobacterium flabelliforme TaxID=2816119 RepID=A0ABS5CTS5_9FLAO|nr:hypothetical protein [Flavobacterium flabelliforme]MBP4142023.1 hypothetical protein [Flavobacterium flabelliforme]
MQHVLILSTKRINIPASHFIQLVISLIDENEMEIDYFGIEIDNPADYLDEQMKLKINTTSFITIHFECDKIDYGSYSDEAVLNFITDVLRYDEEKEIKADDKDIEIIIDISLKFCNELLQKKGSAD